MAESEKMFKGAGKVVKRVPKWAWYVSGGVFIAGGIYYYRSRGPIDEPEGSLDEEGAVGYSDPTTVMPGIVVPPSGGDMAVPAELNTDIPTGTMDLLAGLFQTMGDNQTALLELLAGGGAGGVNPGFDPGGVVTVAEPTAPAAPASPPKPKPNPCTRLDGGYHCTDRVNMGPNAQKTFGGAIGWARIGSGGRGKDHWIDIHVRFCNKLERWRVHPNKGGNGQWHKTWEGGRPGIC